MDKRRKILVVEDDRAFREIVVEVLEEEGCRVRACANSAEAQAAIHEITFDLALIDIMLRGPADMSDRGGLEVLSYLKEINEGTKSIVVSGQLHDLELVRDIWKEYGADDYILKQNIDKDGLDYLLAVLRPALKLPLGGPTSNWNSLVRVLASGGDEVGFVHEALQRLSFKGGQPLLQDALLSASKWLMPLIPRSEEGAEELAGGLVRVYWSKGQGCAIEIIVHGPNVDGAAVEQRLSAPRRTELYRRAKGGLTVIVLARPDLHRWRFAGG